MIVDHEDYVKNSKMFQMTPGIVLCSSLWL